MDIKLNEESDFELDDRNDMPLATGREAFEMMLANQTNAYYLSVIGSTNRDNIVPLMEMYANRVVKENNITDAVAGVEVRLSPDVPNTIQVRTIYDTGETSVFEVSE